MGEYLIFVMNAVSGVHLNLCVKKIQEERENYCFGLRLYRSSECIILLGEGGGKGHVGIGRR